MNQPRLPQPDIRGAGSIQYRCGACGELMQPADAVLVGGRSFHPDHAPEEDPQWRKTPA